MKFDSLKVVLLSVCLSIILCGMFRVSALPVPPGEQSFLDHLGAEKQKTELFANLRDLSVFRIKVPSCPQAAFLYISNFASRKLFGEFTSRLDGRVQRFYLADEVSSFDNASLWRKYIEHQISSKVGITPETIWSQRLLAFQLNPACISASLVWNGTDVPHINLTH